VENNIYPEDLVSLEKFGKNIKLVRHYDSRIKLNNDMGTFKEFVKFDLLEEYQSYQSKDVFNCDNIASISFHKYIDI